MISLDQQPIDANELRALLSAKYGGVEVSEQSVDGRRVLTGSGSVPGALYTVVQALSATDGQPGYYAEAFTPDQSAIPQLTRILRSIRMTSRG